MSLKYTYTQDQSHACAHGASITQADYKSALELSSEQRLIAAAVPSHSQEWE